MPASRLNRRDFLAAGAAGGAALAVLPRRAPALIRSRPTLTHGIQSGDVTNRSAVVWARADRPSRMRVEVARTPRFRDVRLIDGPVLTPDTDFTGKVRLDALQSGRRDLLPRHARGPRRPGAARSEPVVGSFRTAPLGRADVSFVWSGDLAGQGWGINPDLGGYRIFAAMAALEPDFFLCSGDTSTPTARSTVDRAAARRRARGATSSPRRRRRSPRRSTSSAASSPTTCSTTTCARSPPRCRRSTSGTTTRSATTGSPARSSTDERYTERNVDVLAARAKQAFFEYAADRARSRSTRRGAIYRRISHGPLLDVFVLDMRTYKDPNDDNRYADPQRGLLGARPARVAQARARRLHRDLEGHRQRPAARPRRARRRRGRSKASPRATPARRSGASSSSPTCSRSRTGAASSGIVFLTADVHYTAAHHYDPARAAVADFTPFWEFVSGPLNAGAFGPNAARRHLRPGGGVRQGAAGRRTPRPPTATSSSATSRSTAARG